jgi:acyl-CoA oxidase
MVARSIWPIRAARVPTTHSVGTPVDASALDAAALGLLLQPTQRELRSKVLALFRDEAALFAPRYGESVATERARTWARIMRLGELGFFRDTIAATDGVELDARTRYDTVIGCVALLDHSLEVKLGVNLGLFGATVRHLGTDEQRRRWLPEIEAMREFGCFCLTELGHGSNARSIETRALYDQEADCFILHTPTEESQKYWIGGAAESSTLAVVFAQLRVGNDECGIHAFVVRLRDKPGGPVLDGIAVEDCGVKAGLNGVDNGRLWFYSLRVPRKDMLSRTSSVSEDGTYRSDYPTPDARFGAAMAALTGGRVGIAVNSVSAAKIGLVIAIRYGFSRRAFAPAPGEQEVPLMSYATHQRRLMVPLATAYVYSLCADELREMWYESIAQGFVSKEVHVISAGMKALFTWYMSNALQNARECCGGQGYKSENRICVLRADRDVMLTFEGANDVMMQQVAKALLAEYSKTGSILGLDNASRDLAAQQATQADVTTVGASVASHAFIRKVLVEREGKLVKELAMDMRRRTKASGMTAFEAWNGCLGAASDAAIAHMERRLYDMHRGHVLQASRAVVGDSGCAARTAATAAALGLCGELWALSLMDSDASFLRCGALPVARAAEVHSAVPSLCARVCTIAPKLIDGFELPSHLLAPIAFDYVAHNSRARL